MDRIPVANRRPKFRVEELSKQGLLHFGAIAGAVFFLVLLLCSTMFDSSLQKNYETYTVRECNALPTVGEKDANTTFDFADNYDACVSISDIRIAKDAYDPPVSVYLTLKSSMGDIGDFTINALKLAAVDGEHISELEDQLQKATERSIHCPFKASDCTMSSAIFTYFKSPESLKEVRFKYVAPKSTKETMVQFFGDTATVTIEARDRGFEWYEIMVRYILLVISIIVTVAFYFKLSLGKMRYPYRAWALEQKWTFILLLLLIGFNNPVIFVKYYDVDRYTFIMFVDVILQISFLTGYMLAIWCMTDHMSQTQETRKSTKAFYGPKVATLGILWLTICVSIWSNLSQPENAMKGTVLLFVVSVCLGIYLIQLFALIIMTIHKLTHQTTTNITVSTRFKILWGINFVMIFTTAAALYRVNNWGVTQTEFLLGYVGFNEYVFILAFLFSPADSSMPYREPVIPPSTTAHIIVNDEYEMEGDEF
ncbi:hypothetical protein DIPPA_30091 [Diplonema papillatum]|nr:hypothetical protein DIPPA_30091 [Diplonema papillatum]